MKKIAILTTGGTIAGKINPNGYEAAVLNGTEVVENLLKNQPNLSQIIEINVIEVCQIPSEKMSFEILIKLAHEAQKALEIYDGIVILHGTDTMEESAYFLNLVLNTKKPVIFTGAMKASDDKFSDGGKNLFDALITASSHEASQKGVLIVFCKEIHSAREVSKTHTQNLNAFSSPNSDKIGIINQNAIFYFTPNFKHTFKSEFELINFFPKVALIYAYQDFDLDFANLNNFDGIVVAGLGDGNLNDKLLNNLKELEKNGKIIVLSSRCPCGEVSQKQYFISANNLNPQKARILLMCALSKTKNKEKIKQYFHEY